MSTPASEPRSRPRKPGTTAKAHAGTGVSPTSEQVRQRVDALRTKHPRLVSVETVGVTAQGRPIDAVTITDPAAQAVDKQHVLIAAGQHGNEESARLVALRLMDYLLSPDGRPLLKRQKVVILPNVSPDAAEADTYETPAGIRPNLDHPDTGATSPEGKALEKVALELQPELFVDLHARGHAGCSHDMVLFPPSRPYTEDEGLLWQIAQQMAAEGEKAGIPHLVHPLTWPGWGGPDLDQPSSTLWMYRQFKSMVFLTENAEHNQHAYVEKQRAASGVNRLKPLLAMGSRRFPKLYYHGYPCQLAVGMFNAGAVAVGETAAERRASRIELWRNAGAFEKLSPVLPETAGAKMLQVHYTGPTIRSGAGFQVRIAGKWHVRHVQFNGRRLKPRKVDGYYTWQDQYTTYAVAALPELSKGQHEVAFVFQ